MKCRPLITQFPLLVHLHYFLIHTMSAKGTSLDHIPPYSKCQCLLKYNRLSFCSNKLSINIRFLVLGPAGEGCVFRTKSPYSVIFERFPGKMREFFYAVFRTMCILLLSNEPQKQKLCRCNQLRHRKKRRSSPAVGKSRVLAVKHYRWLTLDVSLGAFWSEGEKSRKI